jgi:hypothetical protein
MSNECKNVCASCQYRTVEFVISFGGPDRVTSGDICGLDLPGYPLKTTCIGYEAKRNAKTFVPSAAMYPMEFASAAGPEFETSVLNG